YSLWTIPAPSAWKLNVNRNTGQWGTDYDAQYDFARLDMKVEPLTQPVEQFTIAIEPRGKGGGVLALEWERTRASIPFSRKRTSSAVHLDFAVIADYALVDQAGKLSVLGIFQHIWVQQFP